MDKVQQLDRLKDYKWTASKYYDYPDGQDLMGKLSYTTKFGALLGTVFGVKDTVFYGKHASINQKCFLLLRSVIPLAGTAATFTVTTYCSTVLRGKDDEFNYLLGGVAAGLTIIPFSGSTFLGVTCAVLFGAGGMLKKYSMLNDWRRRENPIPRQPSPYYKRQDFSLQKDFPQTWTK